MSEQHDWRTFELVRCARCDQVADPRQVAIESIPCAPPPARPAARPSAPCAVSIISHNYGQFLAEAIDSVLAQTIPPDEIVVIDDASTDDTPAVAARYRDRGVRYARIDARNVFRARQRAFAVTRAPYVVCLDADDQLPPDYLAAGLREFRSPLVGIVYSDMQEFGDSAALRRFSDGDIERQNFIHAGAIVRREAWEAALAAVDDDWQPTISSHADWQVWRLLLRGGWQAAKSAAVYRYRRHPAAMLRNATADYSAIAGLTQEPVTLVLPLSGRRAWWPRLSAWCEGVAARRHAVTIHAFDSSGDRDFAGLVRRWLASLSCDTAFTSVPSARPGLADLDRWNNEGVIRDVQRAMVRLYATVRSHAAGNWLLIVEDDVLPPCDAPDRLFRALDVDVACVSGALRNRWQPDRWLAWERNFETFARRGQGIEQVHGTGFGCLLVRGPVLRALPITFGQNGNYDHAFAQAVAAAGWRWLIDWDCECTHAGLAAAPAVPAA
jgi:GT2 family glycosyltransferase